MKGPRRPPFGKRGYLWVTLALFAITLTGQFIFGWVVFADEERSHGEEPDGRRFFLWTMKDVMENWQSEFMQLAWQVAGLALLWYVGSPQSKEEEERTEHKIDLILEKVYGKKEAEALKKDLEAKWPKT